MPAVTNLISEVKWQFVLSYEKNLEGDSIIVSGITGSGTYMPFELDIKEKTSIDDVISVLCNHVINCTTHGIQYCTAGFGLKHREGNEKISHIFWEQRVGQAHRFMRRQKMQVSIGPCFGTMRKDARQTCMANCPKIALHGSPLGARVVPTPDSKKGNAKKFAEQKIFKHENNTKIKAKQMELAKKNRAK